jgi:hypothetical protein
MQETSTGRDVACGKVGIVFVDPTAKKVALVPPGFVERLATRWPVSAT